MKEIHAIAFLLALALLVAGCGGGEAQPQEQVKSPVLPTPPAPPEAPSGNLIEITSAGFSPQTLTIKAGEEVAFANKDAGLHWPASAMHPTHTVYPETGGCIGSKFDACKGLQQGETFEFTFNEKGSWKYHDHLNPSLWGTIVVE